MTTVSTKHYAIVSKKSHRFFIFDDSINEYVDAISVADMLTLGAMPTMFPEYVSMFSPKFKKMVVVHLKEVSVEKYVVFKLADHTNNDVEWVDVNIQVTLPDFLRNYKD